MKSILVVDDSIINLRIVQSSLKGLYNVVLVESGEQALAYLSENTTDLILLDLMMPQMDGFETYAKLRELENGKNVPVVFLTADEDVESEIKGLKMGALDFIKKPFAREVIVNRIGHILMLEDLNKNLERKVKEKTIQIEQLSFEIIATIASIIEAKDSYTKGHSVRVAEYSALIAKELGWKEEEVQNIKYIALLHDIGKVGITDNVLNKPGRLTEIEFNIIKSHTTIGGDILKDIKTIADVDSGAKYHHERYDGKGYPCGLAGEEIPTVARIICIADAYDAMNSKRIYRDSLSPEVIRRELVGGRGTQFDPEYLDVFVRLFDEGKLESVSEESEKDTTVAGESSVLVAQILENIKRVQNDDVDYLTGLMSRKAGESKIIEVMEQLPGCIAFIDVDNLKHTNDTMGHLAGDYALAAVGEVLSQKSQDAIAARIGGDEFVYYMIGADKGKAGEIIEDIFRDFQAKKEQNTYLSAISLSVGICTCQVGDNYSDILQKADKALYHVKQSGKCGYYFYATPSQISSKKASIDLEKLVHNLKEQGAYTGALRVEFREFAKIYDFVQHLTERYHYHMQLLLFTLENVNSENMHIDEKERLMTGMEQSIRSSLRTVDVCTRFSGEQFLVILLNAKKEDIAIVINRIFENFYKICDNRLVNISYDVAELDV